MMKLQFRQVLPYLAAIAIFIVITLTYFSPLLEGKQMKQSDITQWKGMSKEILDFREATGEEALWTNSMFGGMPAYQISVEYKGNVLRYLDRLMQLYLPQPAGMVFLYMIGFFILLLVLKVDKWLAVAGAIAFAFSSYLFIIFEAGHNSKAHAIGYMAPVLAGIILTYRGRYLAGGIMAAIFLSLELLTNHLQITYYLMITAGIFVIAQLVSGIREKKMPEFTKATGVLLIASVFAVATNITNIWATYEYGKDTIRGKTELTSEQSNRTSGLDKDYATGWSYGNWETFTLLIPNFQGGSSQGPLTESSKVFQVLKQNNVDNAQARNVIQAMPLYWGTQPGVAGPVYVGAIIIFLFIFALFILDDRYKWWLLSATILSILLAWGKNLMPLTDFFLHYVPGYNKFRAVSMTLVIAELCIPLLAILGLQKVFDPKTDKKKLLKSLYYSLGIAGGISLIFALGGGLFFDFVSPSDSQYSSIFPDWLMAALREDRASLLRSDSFRSLAFILLAAATMWAFVNKKIKQPVFFSVLILLILFDMWSVNRRYLNNDSFVRKSVAAVPFQPSGADQIIMKDKDPNFRVFNQTVGNPFADASTSYFHKSLGGYHGAKLRRYQEIIDHHLVKGNMNVYNMLNAKYFIVPDPEGKQPQMQINMQAMGNVWFVNDAHMVKNADEEIDALTDFTPAETAIYDKRFEDQVKGHMITKDTLATITQTEYKPNHLTYKSVTNKEQLAVFSEIYYDKGWNAYIDGKPAPYFRANYILRAMIVPAGSHTIEFKFEPRVYAVGEKIAYASSILLVLLALGTIGFMIRQKQQATKKA